MNRKISKTEAKEKIESFFSDLKNKTPKEVMKTKKLAMKFNIKLGNRKKEFCKKCFTPYKNSKIRIQKGFKVILCENCGNRRKWKLV